MESRKPSEPAGKPAGEPVGEPPADPPPEEEREVYILSREAVREIDRLAVSEFGIPSILLMENAAFHIAQIAVHLLSDLDQPRALVVCGAGNNGGDGFAAARHLHNAGISVHIVATAADEQYKGDAALNLQIARRMSLPITTLGNQDPATCLRKALKSLNDADGADLLIDAVLGTGAKASDPLRPPLPQVIHAINQLAEAHAITVLAVDIPSGLDADTGEPVPPLAAAVQADVTVTFVGLKSGFTTLRAQSYIGDCVVADIGAPRDLTTRLGTPLPPPKVGEVMERPQHGSTRERRERPGADDAD